MRKSSSGASKDKILEGILCNMQRYADNADLLEEAHTELLCLGCESKISQQGFIKTITSVRDAMKRFPRHPQLQRSSLMLIVQTISCDGKSNRVAMAIKIDKEGWIPGAVMNAMKTHARDVDIQAIGCGIVSELLKSPSYVEKFLKVGALDLVMDALALALATRDADSAEQARNIKASVYEIIFQMFPLEFARKDMQPKRAVKNLKLVLESVMTHMDSPDMLAPALHAIFAASYFHQPNADALGEDGIRITFTAMRSHEGNMEVQAMGSAALGYLVKNCPERKVYAHKLGCLKHVLRMMDMYASESRVQLFSCMFFGYMMNDFMSDSDHVYRTELGKFGLITTLSKALHRHMHDADIVLHAAETLHRFTFIKNDAYRLKVLEDGGCDAIICAMERYKQKDSILVSCLRAIDETLTGCSHTYFVRSLVLRLRMTPLAFQILTQHCDSNSDDGEMIRCCSRVLLHCCAMIIFEAEALKHDAIRVLVRCLKIHPENEDMVREVCSLLGASVIRRTRLQDECREAGAIEALLAVAERHKQSAKILDSVRSSLGTIAANHEQNSAYVMKSMTSKQTRILGRFDHAAETKRRLEGDAKYQTERMGEGAHDADIQACLNKLLANETFLLQRAQCDVVEKRLAVYEEEKLAATCVECGKSAKLLGVECLMKCSACTTGALYCSVECQKAAWPKHKAECKANRRT
jgi:stage V sporulation protein SpoVS